MKQRKTTACKHCENKSAVRIDYYYRFDGSINNVYLCKKCNKKTYIIKKPKPLPTNEEIAQKDKEDISYKLAIWRKEYLKRRLEPKKYEPMLYFLDLYNGVTDSKTTV